MMLVPFFNCPNLLVWVEVDRDKVVRMIEEGLPE